MTIQIVFIKVDLNQDGTYTVQVGIFRLASFDDGIGTMTENGIKFTATDPAGNPIGGMITVNGNVATVTFTDSTWDNIENGRAFEYTKAN